VEFEWDPKKERINVLKHGVSFSESQEAFFDPNRVIAKDVRHSTGKEQRYFCFGRVGRRVLTVRFTLRGERIRIFCAGYWREGKERYEKGHELS